MTLFIDRLSRLFEDSDSPEEQTRLRKAARKVREAKVLREERDLFIKNLMSSDPDTRSQALGELFDLIQSMKRDISQNVCNCTSMCKCQSM